MRELGLSAYRFSIAWPRIVPEGRGRPNAAGLDFYDRFVDELLANGIEPFATLYHWDLPQPLEDRGGWPVRDTVEAFTEYVEVVAERLGDRVTRWITQNEPWVVAWLGYGWGQHAPGRRSTADAIAAAHHVLLSHGRAVEVLRRHVPGADVGITIDVIPTHPLTDSEEDVAAARLEDGQRNRWILDPVLRGSYPEDVLPHYEQFLPEGAFDDLPTIAAPIDLLGVNYYRRHVVRANGSKPVVVEPANAEFTEMGWEIYPDGLYELLMHLHTEYETPPLHVTENGAASPTCGRTAASRIRPGPRTSRRISMRSPARSRPARPCRATSCGRCSTTSSGLSATRSALGSSSSTTRRSNACRRPATAGTGTSSPPSGRRQHAPERSVRPRPRIPA